MSGRPTQDPTRPGGRLEQLTDAITLASGAPRPIALGAALAVISTAIAPARTPTGANARIYAALEGGASAAAIDVAARLIDRVSAKAVCKPITEGQLLWHLSRNRTQLVILEKQPQMHLEYMIRKAYSESTLRPYGGGISKQVRSATSIGVLAVSDAVTPTLEGLFVRFTSLERGRGIAAGFEVAADVIDQVVQSLPVKRNNTLDVHWTEDARSAWYSYVRGGHPGQNVTRMATIRSVTDRPEAPMVTAEDISWAIAVIEACRPLDNARRLKDLVADMNDQASACTSYAERISNGPALERAAEAMKKLAEFMCIIDDMGYEEASKHYDLIKTIDHDLIRAAQKFIEDFDIDYYKDDEAEAA